MLDDLAGKGAVIGKHTQVITGGKIQNLGLDEGKVGGVAGGGGQEALVTPDIVRYTVAAYAAQNVVLGDEEATGDDPLLSKHPELVVERRRKHQHEGGQVVDAGKV